MVYSTLSVEVHIRHVVAFNFQPTMLQTKHGAHPYRARQCLPPTFLPRKSVAALMFGPATTSRSSLLVNVAWPITALRAGVAAFEHAPQATTDIATID